MNSPRMPRIASLDAVRGVAAVIVMIHHMLAALPEFGTPSGQWVVELLKTWPLRLIWGGEEAVVVFFVLSGFVLAQPFLMGVHPIWAHFACRRFLRLYPSYLAALSLAAIAAIALSSYHLEGMSDHFNGAWNHRISGTEVLRGALFLSDSRPINTAFWSLVVEMHISLIFPFLFAITLRLGPVAAPVGAALLGVAVVAYSPLVASFGETWGMIILLPLKSAYFIFPFVLGILLAAYRARIGALLSGPWRDVRGALCILGLGLLGLDGRLPYALGAMAVALGITLVLSVMLSSDWVEQAARVPALQWLGQVSYSLYLCHATVIHALFYGLHNRLPFGAIMALIPPVALAVAWLLWAVVERPSIAWSRRVGMAVVGPARSR